MSSPESSRRRVVGQELGGRELLRDDDRLRLGARARDVVVREREEDDEAEQDREPRREHAEHSGRAVSVVEEAAVGSAAAQEQQEHDGHRRRRNHDRACEEKAHRTSLRSHVVGIGGDASGRCSPG